MRVRQPLILTVSAIIVLSSRIPLTEFMKHIFCGGSIAFRDGVVWSARAGGEGAVGRISFSCSEMVDTAVGFGR